MTNLTERKRLDPVKTRNSILDAALNTFAEKGFDGASFAGIAAAARVPKSLLQYHFGSKEELWKACLERKAGPVLQPLDQFLENPDSAHMAELVTARFRVMQQNPELARMLAWASLGTAPLPNFLAQRQARMIGAFRSGTADLTRLLFALSAMDGWFQYRMFYARALDAGATEDALTEKFLHLLLQAIQTPTADQITDHPQETKP